MRFVGPIELPGLPLPVPYRRAIEAWTSRLAGADPAPRTGTLAPSLAELALALELADLADELTMSRFRSPDLSVQAKPDGSPVTDADRTVERALRSRLADARPDHVVCGEEEGAGRGLLGRWCWYLDPIDGTSRFATGDQHWYTLIALAGDETVSVGVASAPALGRRWWALRSSGAFCNGEPITVSATPALSQAAVNDDWRGTLSLGNTDRPLAKIAQRCARAQPHDGHSYLAVARGLCDVAAGTGGAPWDYAAVKLIVEEAGGRFTNLRGRDTFSGGHALVSNGLIHQEALAALRGSSEGDRSGRASG